MRTLLAAVVVAFTATALGLSQPAGATDGHCAQSPWQTLDTGPGPWSPTVPQTASAHSTIVDAGTVDLTWVAAEPASALGTSAETNNLGVDVDAGTVVSVDYELVNGASPASGSVRLFVYLDNDTSSPGDRPSSAPDHQAAAPDDGSTSGTLSVTTGAGTVGYAGVVYDTSNGGVPGSVRFTGLTVDGVPVPFTACTAPVPPTPSTPAPDAPVGVDPATAAPAATPVPGLPDFTG